MKKLFVFIALLFICAGVNAQVLLKIEGDSLRTFKYSGGDEFNASKLNTNDWTAGMGWTRVLMSQVVAFTDRQIKFSNGLVNFETTTEDSLYVLTPWEVDSNMIKKEKLVLVDSKYRVKYASGSIISKKKYHYGLYELRFKVEEGKGVWPAFWFFGGNKNEEIDAFELKGEMNDMIHVDTHCPDGCDRNYNGNKFFNTNWGGWLPVNQYLHDGFNIMLLEWKTDEIIWYINGYPIAYFKGAFNNPMHLYLNSNVAADGRAFKPGPDASTKWPNNFYCDYIRVWENQSASREKPSLKTNGNATSSAQFESKYLNKPKKKKRTVYDKSKLNDMKGMITLNRVSSTEVILNLLGFDNSNKTNITITGLSSKKSQTFKNTGTETTFKLDAQDKDIEVKAEINGRNYVKVISLP